MLEKFARDVFVGHVFFREFQGDGQHIQAIHAHPTGAVGLLEMPAGGKWRGTVENTDVVEAKEAALENVGAVRILAIDPPGEVEKQLVKDSFEKGAVRDATDATLDLVNAPGGPGVHGRVYVAKSPFVGGQLPVGMHIPFAEEQNELLLGEVGICERYRNAMEREVPGGVPGVFPLVRHGDDVFVVKVRPIFVAAVPALVGRFGPGRIAFEPGTNIVVIKLLGPEHTGEGLAHDRFRVGGQGFRDARFVKLLGFFLTRGEERVKSGSKIVGARNTCGALGMGG